MNTTCKDLYKFEEINVVCYAVEHVAGVVVFSENNRTGKACTNSLVIANHKQNVVGFNKRTQ